MQPTPVATAQLSELVVRLWEDDGHLPSFVQEAFITLAGGCELEQRVALGAAQCRAAGLVSAAPGSTARAGAQTASCRSGLARPALPPVVATQGRAWM
eukprot:1354481-Lingulodinium_polyedra.AAC.1